MIYICYLLIGILSRMAQIKQNELRELDDKLKHYAGMRISFDLDDGVKVNYDKFGDLLADVKAVTGRKHEVIK